MKFSLKSRLNMKFESKLQLRCAALTAVVSLFCMIPSAAAIAHDGDVSETMSDLSQCADSVECATREMTKTVLPGAFLHQLQPRDSVLIGDQLVYGVKFDKVVEGTSLRFGEYKDTLCNGVMPVGPWSIDTLKTYRPKKGEPKKYDLEAGVVITSFDEGSYHLPGIVVERCNPGESADTLLYEGLSLDVMAMPVDTATFKVHDIKDEIRYPLTAAEVLPWVALFIAVVLIIAAIVYFVKKYLRKKADKAAHKDPAHVVALRKLDKYRGNKFWAPEKQKQFYSGVTDILREYIASRYGVGAMEMTTAELFDELRTVFKDEPESRRDLLQRLKELFETADYVKFAKHISDETETSAVLPLAVKFVSETYQTDLQTEINESKEE